MRTLPLTLQSRVGRRIGGLFFISALLPIIVLALLGYRQVRDQLVAEADTQLRQAAKSVGMGVIGQLQEARDVAAVLAAADRAPRGATAVNVAETKARDMFSSLAPVGGRPGLRWGDPPPAVRLSRPTAAALDSGRTVLVAAEGNSGSVWMVLPRAGAGGRLWAELSPEFLLAGAHDRAAAGSGDVTICLRWTEDGSPIHCEASDQGDDAAAAAVWNMFLGYDYSTRPWQVEIRRPLASVLAPIAAFRRTFFATLVAVLGLVVLLTTVQVRRNLQPLGALREGTARLARRDFSQPVVVHSGDEFEDLARSFNLMATDLDKQFRSNAQLIARLNDLTYGALAALARTVDASSPWTAGHSERVTALGMRMAGRLALSTGQMDALLRGGLLHDIGKIGISPLILDKPGRLEPGEFSRIREHPTLGARILAPLDAFAEAIPVVRHHHEWWDGAGYPDGLRGDAIPMLARLLAVADVYDALVSDRPYRPGWPQAQALETIAQGIGSQFDPAMVRLFMAVLDEEGDQARFGPTVEAVR